MKYTQKEKALSRIASTIRKMDKDCFIMNGSIEYGHRLARYQLFSILEKEGYELSLNYRIKKKQ